MSFQDDFKLETYNIDSNKQVLLKAVDYLNTFQNGEKMCNDMKAQNAFTFIRTITNYIYYRESPNAVEFFIEKKFYKILYDALQYIAHLCESFKSPDGTNDLNTKLPQRIKLILVDTTDVMNYLVSSSVKFRIDFFQHGGARAIITMFDNKDFTNSFHGSVFMDTMIMNINWLSKDADQFKSEWLEMNTSKILLNLVTNYQICKLPAYMAFGNIADDKQIQTLNEMHGIISELVKYTRVVSDALEYDRGVLEYGKTQFMEDDPNTPTEYDVLYVKADGYNVRYSITGILLALYRLSVNNRIKYDLYVKYNLKDMLRVIIMKGADIEQKYCLQLLAQLCFDHQVLDLLSKDDELKSYIYNLTKPENCTMKTMRKICEGIMWSLTMKNKPVNEEASKNRAETTHQQKQVMISYNAGSRATCIQIKEQLEKVGFKVWIDINEIHGSSLEAMARAVESSDFILMCVTEKYRQSINCQAEAQYSFKLKKKIIPLILQKGFENVDGWLGIIMGDKIFINFTKYPFEQCIAKVLNEINLHINSTNPSVATASNPVNNSSDTTLVQSKPVYQPPNGSYSFHSVNSAALKWTELEVDNWFKEKKVDSAIIDIIKPCDGELLHQLYTLQVNAPEFFYQSVTKNGKVDLRTALVFSLNLKKLFETS